MASDDYKTSIMNDSQPNFFSPKGWSFNLFLLFKSIHNSNTRGRLQTSQNAINANTHRGQCWFLRWQ